MAKVIHFWEKHSAAILEFGKDLVISIIILVIGITISKIIQKIIKKASLSKNPIEGTTKAVIRAIVRYGILLICAVMILNIFGVNSTSLLAILGAAGLAIGLALKEALGNIASGIMLIGMGTIRIGEFVEFGSYSGIVQEIHLFTTILETPDGIYISAPNSSIYGNPLKNYTRNGKRRMELSIGISYTDSIDTAFQVMQNIIAAEPRFLQDPAPQVILQAIESNSVKITIRAWSSVDDYWNIHWDTNKIIKTRIEAAGLNVPLPQRDVRIVQ